jgi:hypothetical protein
MTFRHDLSEHRVKPSNGIRVRPIIGLNADPLIELIELPILIRKNDRDFLIRGTGDHPCLSPVAGSQKCGACNQDGCEAASFHLRFALFAFAFAEWASV